MLIYLTRLADLLAPLGVRIGNREVSVRFKGGEVVGLPSNRIAQLGIDDLKRPNDAFEVGESLTMKVTRVDVPNHRLILSVKAWLTEQDDIALAEWTSRRNQSKWRNCSTR